MPNANGWAPQPTATQTSQPSQNNGYAAPNYNTGLNSATNAMYTSSSNAPPTFNPLAVNGQQANANFATANYNKALNNNNVTTPWGSMTYQQTGTDPTTGAPIWSTNIGLNNNQQTALTAQQGNAANVNQNAGSGLVNQINQNANTPLSQSMGDPAIQNAINSQFKAQTGLLQPTFGIQSEQLDTQLANQGLQPGTDAYNNAKNLLAQQQNNAYTQIANNAQQTGLAQQNQMFGQNVTAQNNPLNQYLALNSGTQVQNPSFPTQNTSAAPATNVLGGYGLAYGAGLNGSNYATGAQNSMLNGLVGLGQVGSSLYGMMNQPTA